MLGARRRHESKRNSSALNPPHAITLDEEMTHAGAGWLPERGPQRHSAFLFEEIPTRTFALHQVYVNPSTASTGAIKNDPARLSPARDDVDGSPEPNGKGIHGINCPDVRVGAPPTKFYPEFPKPVQKRDDHSGLHVVSSSGSTSPRPHFVRSWQKQSASTLPAVVRVVVWSNRWSTSLEAL